MKKNILITGASSGIGAALARQYAKNGHRIFLGARRAEELESVAKDCTALGGEAHIQVVDVTAKDIMHQWILGIDKRYPLDIVIANAGISGGTSGISAEEFMQQSLLIFDVNVGGVLNTIAPILPRMVARKKGHIAVMSSLASFAGWPGAPAYSASKGAVRMYAEALNGRYQREGVTVSAICPGFVETPMTDANPFHMPLLMNVGKAARIIAQDIEKNESLITFPKISSYGARFIGILPLVIRRFLLAGAPEKTPLQNF